MELSPRLGMVRTREGTLRYTINGEDQGLACDNIPPNVYAVVDLYGQCAQVGTETEIKSAMTRYEMRLAPFPKDPPI